MSWFERLFGFGKGHSDIRIVKNKAAIAVLVLERQTKLVVKDTGLGRLVCSQFRSCFTKALVRTGKVSESNTTKGSGIYIKSLHEV